MIRGKGGFDFGIATSGDEEEANDFGGPCSAGPIRGPDPGKEGSCLVVLMMLGSSRKLK